MEARIKLQLSGSFKLVKTNQIVFEPGQFSVEEVNIPVSLLKKFVKDMGFTLNLDKYNIPLIVEKIRVSSDKLVLEGGSSAGEVGQ
jgi:hypothetical protein